MKKRELIILFLLLCVAVSIPSYGSGSGSKVTSNEVGKAEQKIDGELLEYDTTAFYHYTEGLKASRLQQDRDGALEHFERALELDSLHAPSLYEMASFYLFLAPQKAKEYSRKANQIEPNDYWYALQLGRLYVVMGEYAEAQTLFDKMIELKPKVPENYTMLAALYEQTNQPFSAIATLERGELLLGKIEMLVGYKIELLIKMKLYDKAVTEGEFLVQSHPYNYENHLALAQIYSEVKRDSLAQESYTEALRLNPDGIDVLGAQRDFYRDKGDNTNYIATTKRLIQSDKVQLEQKIEMYNTLTKSRDFYRANYFQIRDLASTLYGQHPNKYSTTEIYADNIMSWGDVEEGINIYKQYIESADPQSLTIEPYLQVISSEAYLKEYNEVAKYLDIADRKFPKNSELHLLSGWSILQIEGREKEAERAYKNAYKYAQEDSLRSVIMATIGDMYHMQGREKKSFSAYRKAIKIWDRNIHALNNYAYYLVVKGQDMDRALDMALRVMELEPANATYIDTYGWILYKMGRYEEAKKVMQQAIALDTSNSDVLMMHYGDILYKLGDHYMATVYWRRAGVVGHDPEQVEQRLALPPIKSKKESE